MKNFKKYSIIVISIFVVLSFWSNGQNNKEKKDTENAKQQEVQAEKITDEIDIEYSSNVKNLLEELVELQKENSSNFLKLSKDSTLITNKEFLKKIQHNAVFQQQTSRNIKNLECKGKLKEAKEVIDKAMQYSIEANESIEKAMTYAKINKFKEAGDYLATAEEKTNNYNSYMEKYNKKIKKITAGG